MLFAVGFFIWGIVLLCLSFKFTPVDAPITLPDIPIDVSRLEDDSPSTDPMFAWSANLPGY